MIIVYEWRDLSGESLGIVPFVHGFGPAGGGSSFSASVGQGTRLDAGQILRKVFDPTNAALRATTPGAPSGAAPGRRDAEWILKDVYDPDTNTLRVTEVP